MSFSAQPIRAFRGASRPGYQTKPEVILPDKPERARIVTGGSIAIGPDLGEATTRRSGQARDFMKGCRQR